MSDKPKSDDIKNAELETIEDIPHVNRGFAITVISLFVAILILPTLIWGALLLVNQANPAVMETLNFDTGENRTMAEFPEDFDPKTFTSEVESWYNDNLPFRSVLYKTQETLESRLEQPYKENVMPLLIEWFHGSQSSSTGNEVDTIVDLFETTEGTEPAETETVPTFEPDDQAPSSCEHTYAEESVTVLEATCTEWGIIGYTCTKCDYIGNKEYTQKIPHDYVSSVKETPACGTKYEETLVCRECRVRETYSRVKKHSAGREIRTVEPTQSEYGYTLVVCSDCSGEYRTALKNRLPDDSYLPPILHNKTLEGKHNWLFYTGDDSIGYYQGSNLLSYNTLADYVNVLNQLQVICQEKNIKLAVAFWPNKELVYPEFMPEYEIVETVKRVDLLTRFINENSDVPAVYPLAQLKAAKPYWQVYYKHDTHWNPAGGFIGVQALYEALGFETTSLIDLPVIETKRTGGDLINIGGLSASNYTGDKSYDIDYRPDVTVKTANSSPINGHTTHTSSTGKYDMNFVMLSDSFRGSMKYFLERDFTSCFLTHRSQVRDADVVAAIKDADVLVISAVERYDYSVIDTARVIIQILSEQ
ncbi:MAG: hypothetical protein IJY39_10465 [Clostridia bacterium]|nr:hypothetical protein [Clostridia bacterium]